MGKYNLKIIKLSFNIVSEMKYTKPLNLESLLNSCISDKISNFKNQK